MVRQGNAMTVTGQRPQLGGAAGTAGSVRLAGVSKVFGRGS